MPLVVETGAGVAGADSYLSLAEADAHHVARGAAEWALATTGAREAALRRATAGVDGLFAGRWKGVKAVPWAVSVLAWPRRDVRDGEGASVVAADAIPFALKVAVAEAARLELEQPGALAEAARTLRRFAIGPLAVEYAGGDAAPPAVALPLAPLLEDRAAAVPRLASTGGRGGTPFRVGMHDGERA
ncbi:MAG: DnaT-like ssDNA-binding protein [Alphaproteobacteria bacterium]